MVNSKNLSFRAAFLDRDGVINKCFLKSGIPTPPRNCDEVTILEGVVDALSSFRENGVIPVVVTNQPDVKRGIITKEEVDSINEVIKQLTKIQYFYVCFHDNLDNCKCRKPGTEMLLNAARDLRINLNNSFIVGDRWRDIAAGQSLGIRSYFIDNSYLETQPKPPYTRVSSLWEVAQIEVGDHNVSKN
jgi:D-glycero-D-manno-heptose 1,7-bisphosphate phosphatase